MEHNKLVQTARLTGIWYLLLGISGILGFLIFHPQIFDSTDPQRTVKNIIELESTARIRILFELVIVISQALTAVWFFKLFREINKWAATSLAIWGTVNATVIMVSAIAMSSAIDIANSSHTFQEKVVLVQLLNSVISNAWSIGGLFFGLWLIPLGHIVISSRRMPMWLGRILVIGGIGYIVQTFMICTGLKSSFIDILAIPATVGEFWMIGYLLVYGIRPEIDNDK